MYAKSFLILAFLMLMASQGCHQPPLKGKKILFTTPDGYAQRMQDALQRSGATAVSLPMIETTLNEDNPALETLLSSPKQADYIAFSSRKAIQAFAQCREKLPISRQVNANIQYCAIGKDAEYLHSRLGIVPSITPSQPSPAGIVEALKNLPETRGKTIAVLAPTVEGVTEPNVVPNFISQLIEIGMNVQRINVYTTRPTNITHKNKWLKSLLAGEYRVIAFTSTAEVEAFLHLTEGHSLPSTQIFACFGPFTANNAKKMGLNVKIIASDYSSFNGFVKEMELYFENKREK